MSTEAKPTYALVCESGWPHAIFNSLGVAELQAVKRSVAPGDVNPSAGLHVYSVVRYVPAVEQACAVPAPAAYPRKAIEVKVTANGFTWDEVLGALRERLSRLEEHREHAGGCSASGYGASHTCDVMLRDVGRDQFADESIAWLESRKEPT